MTVSFLRSVNEYRFPCQEGHLVEFYINTYNVMFLLSNIEKRKALSLFFLVFIKTFIYRCSVFSIVLTEKVMVAGLKVHEKTERVSEKIFYFIMA
jgi:hypothetical protein